MIREPQNNDLHVFLAEAEQNGLVLADVEAACLTLGVGSSVLLSRLSVEVAEGFLSGTLAFETCSSIMNGIANAIFDLGMTGEFPQPALSLYQAFDQGEWGRIDDPETSRPSEQYTRPRVVEILRGLQG
ncbi:hypothetical protein HX866_26990 [Pseudomonas gingeri]|uniref:hypothetical protein n=1 Tax=Pseudomonas gingeri TaxID=117681 RepID=UPI0015A04811|nr:hypothetical protein [Pseudomonas gingeri]NWA28541.1 hypothetical protein [Pseudomonas gingeri]